MRAALLSAVVLVSALGLAACGERTAESNPPREATQKSPRGPQAAGPNIGIPNIATRAEVYTKALGDFLSRGPTDGTWAVQGPTLERTWHFAPNPIHAHEVLAAQVKKDGTLESVESISRLRAALFFYKAPTWLFMLNYRIVGPPQIVPGKDGTNTVRLTWRPENGDGLLTERVAWFSEDGALLQIEDKSRTGVTIRSVRRVLDSKLTFDLDDLLARSSPCCPDVPNVAADDLNRLADATFPVFQPGYLPSGYLRIRADYEETALADPGPAVQRATLLYSDGMGIISVAIAPTDHMDAITRHYSKMPVRDGNSDVCPGLPAEPQEVVRRTGVIRMRQGVCRTVLRLDGISEGVSVMVIGRNELPTEAYLRMMQNLERIKFDHVDIPQPPGLNDARKQDDATEPDAPK